MIHRPRRWVGALTLVVATVACAETRAQSGTGAGGTQSATMGVFANPYMNPYVNPYLNPYATQQRMSPGDAAMYFFGAQAAMGGIGSGQLSGVRPGPRTPGQKQVDSRPKDDARQVRGVPSSVARYFQRGPQKPESASFYNRQGRYHMSSRQR